MTPRERPIIFSGEMVLAILCGRKTQTRRVNKWDAGNTALAMCPHGVAGDRLWVRETFRTLYDPATCLEGAMDIDYRADGIERIMDRIGQSKWRPSIFMPRWASRITLEIVGVRLERLMDISEEDARDEGVMPDYADAVSRIGHPYTAMPLFRTLWDSINGKKHPWSSNPCVWRIEFKRIKP